MLPPDAPTDLSSLDDDLLAQVFQACGVHEAPTLCLVSKRWQALASNQEVCTLTLLVLISQLHGLPAALRP